MSASETPRHAAPGSPDGLLERCRALAEAGEIEGALSALAELDSIRYDRVREQAAQLLKCRLETLDREVERVRSRTEEQALLSTFAEPEPWPEPVYPSHMLEHLCRYFRRFAVLPEHGDTILALWAAHTWVFDTHNVTPRLVITSPQKGCGKSTVLDLLRAVVRRPIMASHATPAALFRVIERYQPTVLLDEADTYLSDNDDLRRLLNAGHHVRGAVWRTVGDEHEPRPFPVFAPVAIAAIGGVPETIVDRAVVLPMRRRRADEPIERFREETAGCEELRRKLARFGQRCREQLRQSDPQIPDSLSNRSAENWRPLLAIADLARRDWPERARAAALAQAPEVAEENHGVMILADVRRIFEELGAEEIRSSRLCGRLAAREDRPWAEISSGNPITPRKLADLLRPFGIAPRHRRDGNVYRKADFVDAWSRYLPAEVDLGDVAPCAPEDARGADSTSGGPTENTTQSGKIDLSQFSALSQYE